MYDIMKKPALLLGTSLKIEAGTKVYITEATNIPSGGIFVSLDNTFTIEDFCYFNPADAEEFVAFFRVNDQVIWNMFPGQLSCVDGRVTYINKYGFSVLWQEAGGPNCSNYKWEDAGVQYVKKVK